MGGINEVHCYELLYLNKSCDHPEKGAAFKVPNLWWQQKLQNKPVEFLTTFRVDIENPP